MYDSNKSYRVDMSRGVLGGVVPRASEILGQDGDVRHRGVRHDKHERDSNANKDPKVD